MSGRKKKAEYIDSKAWITPMQDKSNRKVVNGKKSKEHQACDCHKYYGTTLICDLTCMKCNKAEKVVITETRDGFKRIEVSFI